MSSERPPDVEIDPAEDLYTQVVVETGRLLWETRDLPDILWHYTDAPGALGIVRGRELWATHAFFMNDASELRRAYPLLQEEIDIAEQRLAGNNVMQTLTTLLGVVISDEGRDPDIYAVCFCENGDLLSQWRAYGRAGGGYALGFDGPMLLGDATKTFGLSLTRVIYDEQRQRDLAREIVERTIGIYGRFIAERPGQGLEALQAVGRAFAYAAQTYAYRIKDGAFSEEQEWRLIYSRAPDDSFEAAERTFRSSARGLIPYVEIKAKPSTAPSGQFRLDLGLNALPLRVVRVGPTAHPETSELAMRYLLGDLALEDVEVVPSSIPLRA